MGYLDQRVAHLLALVLELAQLLASSPRRTATSGVRTYELRARATLGYRENKMSPGKLCKSCVLRSIYILILHNDYDYQIITEVAQLRQHKQRLNDLRTQLG